MRQPRADGVSDKAKDSQVFVRYFRARGTPRFGQVMTMLDNVEWLRSPQEIKDWILWARRPWNPVAAAERQCDALAAESEGTPGLAAYEHLQELATRALRWLEENRCPDEAVAARFAAKMVAYHDLAETVRSTMVEVCEDAAAAGLNHPQGVVKADGDETKHFALSDRRQAPRRAVGWHGICQIEGDSGGAWRECWVIEISMQGFAITLNQPMDSELVGRHISVEIPELSDSFNIRLGGAVRNAGPTSTGALRVGIEFEGSFPIGGRALQPN